MVHKDTFAGESSALFVQKQTLFFHTYSICAVTVASVSMTAFRVGVALN